MKKHLLIGGALILAAGFASARTAQACNSISIMNGAGSPPVVQGNIVRFFVNGYPPEVDVYVDGVKVWWTYDTLDSFPTIFYAIGEVPVPYGSHTMFQNWENCTIDFTTVPHAPPPPQPPVAPTLSDVNGGVACPSDTLQWSAVPGAVTYQLWSRQTRPSIAASMSQIWSGTNLSRRVSMPRNWGYVYAVNACNENGCGALSNFNSINGGTCP